MPRVALSFLLCVINAKIPNSYQGEEDEEEDEEVFTHGEEVEEMEDEGALQGSGLASTSTAASVTPAKPAPPPAGPMMKQMAITLGIIALIKNLDLTSPL